MRDPEQLCLVSEGTSEADTARTVHIVDEATNINDLLGACPEALREIHGREQPGRLYLVPGEAGSARGVAHAVFVCATDLRDAAQFGALATGLPAGLWRPSIGAELETRCGFLQEDLILGFCMGAYDFAIGRDCSFETKLVCPPGPVPAPALALARATWLGRDLVNMPANLLGPSELAASARDALAGRGATCTVIEGEALTRAYPCLAAVGAGSDRPPVVFHACWKGSTAGADAPLLSLVGKGVCFDTGGYDIKPASGMLRMKKDMGGAALMLALACVIVEQDLPIRLELRLGCVENSISGHAMRPGDILTTRAGLTVEVGNTDAEGRLVLCDLLSEACESKPSWLLDAATLTGAARVALGPDLPALFTNDENFGRTLLEAGQSVGDAMWQLPLWHGYDAWLRRKTASLGNVTDKPMAGAITAALFLQHFVSAGTRWVHIDTYAWNDSARTGKPEGGETLGLRALHASTLRMINE
ncbi:leucyl aminopeptidase family protein [Swaminathania salitolerans]|uniref:Aminopeptidase n=1 Tax=Swaminathania salitolerans TaxID=182838 RepID=A0A511BPH1_9PROT|nr:leucyl aminopeptidase family protein [Swaminathania salitolerans]GBQ15939.1 leucyl aminopeptidase [Swaminathania salitolerans LMG 21291]GEL01544.1 aminopeptidase [Swaminathania salitolerans]